MSYKHGMWKTPEFNAWNGMQQRCHNPKNKSYARYGGRGIVVCEEWRADFMAFFAHIGPRPSSKHSVDRKNNSGNYEPGNVRWATPYEQVHNQRPRRAHKRKTHCKYGHELAVVGQSVNRTCKACHRIVCQAYEKRKKVQL